MCRLWNCLLKFEPEMFFSLKNIFAKFIVLCTEHFKLSLPQSFLNANRLRRHNFNSKVELSMAEVNVRVNKN